MLLVKSNQNRFNNKRQLSLFKSWGGCTLSRVKELINTLPSSHAAAPSVEGVLSGNPHRP